ncbi:MAG: mechanosensitive ion channel [Candidatus Portnoybacteria bacterium]|nr:mechanosensitive ion channel [Candidatus Portnoybacteria bacterium]
MNDLFKSILDAILPWLSAHGFNILIIIVIGFLINRFGKILIDKIVRKAVSGDRFLSKEAEEKRENTLVGIFSTTVKIVVWLVVLMMIISEIGVDIGPILAGAGIAGLAFGFGAQYLIKDIIAGMFIIFENQYRIGDVVCLGDTCGSVEEITLRTTILRDIDGAVHHISNGGISKASNLSKEFARVNVDIGVSYDSDLEKVIKVVNEVGKDLANDSEWGKHIIKAPEFLRVNAFQDSAIEIKILGETKPLQQWNVMGELRKRLKIAFDKEGIEIPFPQRVVHQK